LIKMIYFLFSSKMKEIFDGIIEFDLLAVLGGNRGYPEENHPGRGRLTIHLRSSLKLG